VSDQSQGPGWWLASDGKWYPPAEPTAPVEAPPAAPPSPDVIPPPEPPAAPAAEPPPAATAATGAPAPGWWLASDGNWYPPEQASPPPAAPPTAPPSTPPTAVAPAAPPPMAPPGTPKQPMNLKKPLMLVGAGVFVVFVLVAGVLVYQRFTGRISDNAIPLGVDELPSSELTLADNAVVVRSDGGNAVKEISPDGKRIVLDAGAEGADQLQPGKAMILTGVTAVTADKVERQGDDVVISATPAALTDLIKDGKIHFDHQDADLSKATLRVFEPSPDLVTETSMGPPHPNEGEGPAGGGTSEINDSTIRLTPHQTERLFAPPIGEGESAAAFADLPLAQGTGQSVSRSGELGGFHYDFDARISGDAINFTLGLTKDQNGFRIAINVTADVSGVGFDGDIEISAATMRQFRLDTANLRGKATITGSAVAGPEATRLPVTLMHLPMSVQIPFPIYGIPFTIGIEAEAKIELAFTSRDASVEGSFDARFSGSGGLSVNNGSLTARGAFNQDWEDPLAAVAGLSIAPASLIVTIQFPKVSLGVGIALARASAYIEAVYAFAPTISGVTNITPCRAEPVALTIKAGYTASFLGHEIVAGERQIAQRSAAPFDPPTRVCQI